MTLKQTAIFCLSLSLLGCHPAEPEPDQVQALEKIERPIETYDTTSTARDLTIAEKGEMVAQAMDGNAHAIVDKFNDGDWMVFRVNLPLLRINYEKIKNYSGTWDYTIKSFVAIDSPKAFPYYQVDYSGLDHYTIISIVEQSSYNHDSVKAALKDPYGISWEQKLDTLLQAFSFHNGMMKFKNKAGSLYIVRDLDSVFRGKPLWLEDRVSKWDGLVQHFALQSAPDSIKQISYIVRSSFDKTKGYIINYPVIPAALRGKYVPSVILPR